MADYDLSKTIIPYLDRHLAFPILNHLISTEIFPEEQVQAAQYELAKSTNLVDYAANLFAHLHPDEDIPAEYEEKRKTAVSTHQRLQEDAQAVLDVINIPEVAQSLRQDKMQNLQFLKDNYQLTLEQITVLNTFGQFQFSIGNYTGAADYLYHFRILSTDTSQTLSAHWGKLACDILIGRIEVALEELNALRDVIDSRSPPAPTGTSTPADSSLLQLHSRTWLAHWSLFIYFNTDLPNGRVLLLETFLSPTYLNTIQTSCPWILRYVSTAAILSRSATTSTRVKNAIRDIIKVIQMESYQYSDPITSFLSFLYVDFDFENAQKQLRLAEQVVENDFFLHDYRDEFLDNARYLISEAYCRIHQKIDIGDLSDRLNLSRDEGEKWIVNLIRETRMGAEAKIDLEKNIIQITRPPQPTYQTIIEKTRGLALRTQALGAAVSRSGTQTQPAAVPIAVQ